MQMQNEIRSKFLQLFKTEPLLIRAPGRINLIGEHTDYNDGFVMPAAIDKEIIFAIGPTGANHSVIHSAMFSEDLQVDLAKLEKIQSPSWANYLLGVLFQLRQKGVTLKNFNCVFNGNIPAGAGLSSSAALETGFAFALQKINDADFSKIDLIKMAQWSEHNYVGVQCGIMDQFASVMGNENHALLLDCRDLSFKYLPLNLGEYTILLCDSNVKHALVDSEYNTRRSECEEGVRILKRSHPKLKSLRDATLEMLEKHKPEFTGKVYQRCLYVVQEINRVQKASEDLEKGDLKSFGKKMFETHHGLSQQYEVSCKELDYLVELASESGSVLGSRMMGGGFGGCTINIIKETAVDRFVDDVSRAYMKKFSIEMQPLRVRITNGTSVVS
jgi:galactokinase